MIVASELYSLDSDFAILASECNSLDSDFVIVATEFYPLDHDLAILASECNSLDSDFVIPASEFNSLDSDFGLGPEQRSDLSNIRTYVDDSMDSARSLTTTRTQTRRRSVWGKHPLCFSP